jgi:hypothetical protein
MKKSTVMSGIFMPAINVARKGLTKPVELLALIWLSSMACLNGQTFPLQTGNNLPATNSLAPVPTGILLIDYNFFSIPDSLDVYYDNSDIFSSGFVTGVGEFVVPYGPGASSSITIIMNQDGGIPEPGDIWQYTPSIVPEPKALALFIVGAVVLTFGRRQQRRGV